ncbi:hypothetical protein BLX87_00950, partial [Bacillus sp. VT-16-64]
MVYFSLEESDRSKDIQRVALQFGVAPSSLENAPLFDIGAVNNYSLENMLVRNKSAKLLNRPNTHAPFSMSFNVTTDGVSHPHDSKADFL